jgi:transcriptional regulator with XRE-family HTH domain
MLIRTARNDAGLSQAHLARRLGVSQAAIAKLERTGSNPTVDTLDKVLWATGYRLTLNAQARQPGVD